MDEHRLGVRRTARIWSSGNLASAGELWIVVHGYGQLAASFLAEFDGVAGEQRAVVAPEALNRFYNVVAGIQQHRNAPVGATWMTREDRDAEIADYVAYLDDVAATFGAGRPLTVLGFSQGVATVTRWVALGRTTISRLILWAGALPDDLDLGAAASRFPEPVDVVNGTHDRLAPWVNVERHVTRLHDAGIAHRLHSFDGGHRIDRGVLAMLAGTTPAGAREPA